MTSILILSYGSNKSLNEDYPRQLNLVIVDVITFFGNTHFRIKKPINIDMLDVTSIFDWRGCLAWSGYLPYTQVVMGSNPIPSMLFEVMIIFSPFHSIDRR